MSSTTVNKRAGFWIRFLARLIDVILTFGLYIAIVVMFLTLKPKAHFDHPWKFYISMILGMLEIFLYFVVMPTFTTMTLGMYICRIKITFETKKKFEAIFKRELFLSIVWIVSILLTTIFINHTLVDKFVLSKPKDVVYVGWDSFRVSLVNTVVGIMLLGQLISIISIIIRKDKGGLHDSYSKTKTVYINKSITIEEKDNSIKYRKPRLIKNTPVIWEE